MDPTYVWGRGRVSVEIVKDLKHPLVEVLHDSRGPGCRAPAPSARVASVACADVRDYSDVLAAGPKRRASVPEIAAEAELVVETADGSFCGAVVTVGTAVEAGEKRNTVTLEDRHGARRVFPLLPAAFLIDGQPVTLVRPQSVAAPRTRRRTASGSLAVAAAPAQVARASRIWVEGSHDAALLERIWGDDLRVAGVVVEPMNGIDHLADAVGQFGPAAHRRLGVLVDHLVPGSKESRIVADLARGRGAEWVLVTGHPYVDVWQAVKPLALGIEAWPDVPRTVSWKDGVCAALGVSDPREMWRRVLSSVDSYSDVEVPLLRAVEELIDFVTD
jgi:hypothetical protein